MYNVDMLLGEWVVSGLMKVMSSFIRRWWKHIFYVLPPRITRPSDEQEDPAATHDIVMNIPKYFLTLLHAAAY